MITAYIDETGHPDDPRRAVFGLGGFIGDGKSWEKFNESWSSMYSDPDSPFHMKDFAHRKRKFADWQEEQRRKLLSNLVGVIRESKLVPVAVVLCLYCYRALLPERKKSIGNIYGFVFSHLLAQISVCYIAVNDFSIFSPKPSRITVVLADSPVGNRTWEQWWKVKTNEDEGILAASLSSLLISSVALNRPNTCIPLQAADLWAYELGHHFEYTLPNEKEPRFAFREIYTMPSVDGVGQPSFVILHKEVLESDQVVTL